jgi:hypothetical protein
MSSIFELRTATAEFSIEISKSSDSAGIALFTGCYHGHSKSIVRRINRASDFEPFHSLETGVLEAGTQEELLTIFRQLVETKHGPILEESTLP